jgi:uncharacterized protein (DUF1778 family)
MFESRSPQRLPDVPPGHAPRSPRTMSHPVRRLALAGACALAIAVSTPGAVDARVRLQQPVVPGPGAGAPNAQANPISLGELNRLFEAYAVVQAQDYLKLTDEQYPEFVARLKALQDARRRHLGNHNRIIADLNRMLRQPDDQIDDKTVRATYEALDREDDTAQVEIKKAFDNVIGILDVRQRARFRVFEENLERRKLDLLSRVQRPNRKLPGAAARP